MIDNNRSNGVSPLSFFKPRFNVPKLCAGVVAASLISLSATSQAESNSEDTRPNILVIMADDLGYSDLSAFGSEIQTPNIDSLASTGRMLTNFHTAAVCSPTRASLMTGVDHHLAGLGNMAEVVGLNIVRDKPLSAPWGQSNTYTFDNIPDGYRGYISEKTVTMPELLSDAGYHTYMVGKWHLAFDVLAPTQKQKRWYRLKESALPYARGFEKSFSLVDGAGAHYAPPQIPTPLDLTLYAEDDRVFPAKELPKDFYSTEFFTDKLLSYIDASQEDGKPFFAYAAYTAPHWPLQAPQDFIDEQKGRYDEGYEVVKEKRLARMQELGLLKNVSEPSPGAIGPKSWNDLTPEEQQKEAKAMEIYAAMVTNLDHHVGRLISHLKDIGEYDNTFIIFMSDNGAEAAPAFMLPIPGTQVDESLENMGKPGSVVAYGPRWAEVSSAPFRFFKGFTGAEGGTASPLIVKLNHQAEQRPTSDARLQVTDIFPTVLDVAGVDVPGSVYKGKEIFEPKGVSFLSSLQKPEAFSAVHPEGTVFADELMGASYVVKDNWKLAQQAPLSKTPVFRKDVPFSLYDLSTDRAETRDLSATHPEVVEQMKQAYQVYLRDNNVLEHASSANGR
ncbi:MULTISPECIES: arylsulfatase [Neptunomonas]|uniref:arylsulfatase n=1 Tax=Neptunomonas TaxID=75687 RepID=UPI0025AFAB00|nr:arylsulfatase [Neptunomonas sp. CHC150]MDN2658602.1 arylsulfatase [Neptunomonas sp. CHC150]